jgi:hypothetical protein
LLEHPEKGPRLLKNDEEWESTKDDIHAVYITQMKTFPTTMLLIQEGYGFRAS